MIAMANFITTPSKAYAAYMSQSFVFTETCHDLIF